MASVGTAFRWVLARVRDLVSRRAYQEGLTWSKPCPPSWRSVRQRTHLESVLPFLRLSAPAATVFSMDHSLCLCPWRMRHPRLVSPTTPAGTPAPLSQLGVVHITIAGVVTAGRLHVSSAADTGAACLGLACCCCRQSGRPRRGSGSWTSRLPRRAHHNTLVHCHSLLALQAKTGRCLGHK